MKIPASLRLCVFAFLPAAPALAQDPPRINAVSPAWIQRGTSAEVVFTGERFADVEEVHVFPDGIEAEVLNDEPEKKPAAAPDPMPAPKAPAKAGAKKGKPVAAKKPAAKKPPGPAPKGAAGSPSGAPSMKRPTDKLRVRLTVDDGAGPGIFEVRLISPAGVSNPVNVNVGILPVAADAEPNNAPAQARAAALPAMVLGAIHAPLETDWYRLTLKKGETFVADLYASRIGSKLDGSLRLFDAAGAKELARSEDVRLLDPTLDFTAPADGEYLLEIRDYLYRGDPGMTYRLEMGAIPVVRSVFPFGGPRGKSVEVAATGFNLGAAATQRVTFDGRTPLGVRDFRPETPLGPAPALPFDVSDLAEAADAEPNDDPAKAQAVPAAAAVNGRIGATGDVDRFRFTVDAKTPALTISVQASRFGSRLDPYLTLADASGKIVAKNDDAPGAGMDARIEPGALAPGDYVVSLRDLAGRGGENFPYRLTIAPPRAPDPDFDVRFLPDAIAVNRGSHAKVWCEVIRAGGLEGDVQVAFEDLPRGVTCRPVAVPTVPSSILFTVSAEPYATPGTWPVRLAARGRIGGRSVAKTAEPESEGRVVRQAFLTVLGDPLFTVEPAAVTSGAGERAAEIARIEKTLATSTPELDAAQAAWETSEATRAGWAILRPAKFGTIERATMKRLPDGSFLLSERNPAKDTYVLVAETKLTGITAFRLEAMADPSLPGGGPGRAPNGNLVLSEFKVERTKLSVRDSEGAISPSTALGAGAAGPPETNTECPVSGKPASDEHVVEHEGKKVRFCCEKCPAEFRKNPAAFLAKLPQFAGASAAAPVTNTTCPVSGQPAKPEHSLVHEGKKVLFCCEKCPVKFRKDPAKYLGLLPQFAAGAGAAGGEAAVPEMTKAAPTPLPGTPVEFARAVQSFNQDNFPASASLDNMPDTGWALAPRFGETHTATFETKAPLDAEGGSTLIIRLEQQSIYGQHTLGRFRISATTAKDPSGAQTLPANVRMVLDTPVAGRTPEQKKELSAYYLSIAPGLQKDRDRLARLRAEAAPFPPVAIRGKPAVLGVKVTRAKGFTGDVALSVEGFSAGRDDKRMPAAIDKNFVVPAVVLGPDQDYAVLPLTAKPDAELGARPAVIRAEGRQGGRISVQVSRAFPLAVNAVDVTGPPREPDQPGRLLNGIEFAYYEEAFTTLPDFSGLKPVKTGTTGTIDIGLRNRNDNIAFVFSGYLKAPKDGVYLFHLSSDDGSRLLIGDQIVVDHDGLHGMVEKSGGLALKAGLHKITVPFFQGGGGVGLDVFWESKDLPRQKIPAEALFWVKK